MNIQQGLKGLLTEIETITKTDLPPQRWQYFRGAKHYLQALQQMTEENTDVPKPNRRKKSKAIARPKHDSSPTEAEFHPSESTEL